MRYVSKGLNSSWGARIVAGSFFLFFRPQLNFLLMRNILFKNISTPNQHFEFV